MTKKSLAQQIFDDPRELFMNSPVGYPFAQRIHQRDIGNLKSFLINTTPDEAIQESIRQTGDVDIIQSYLDNGFTFDEEWFGARLLDWQKERG